YASGGFENKIWILSFWPGQSMPLGPVPRVRGGQIEAPFIDITAFATSAPVPYYNDNHAAVYPTGLAISRDGNSLYVANNLGDSLGIVADLHRDRQLVRIDLHRDNAAEMIYPYGVVATSKVYVSCWNAAAVAVVDPGNHDRPLTFIPVERH